MRTIRVHADHCIAEPHLALTAVKNANALHCARSIIAVRKEVDAMGGQVIATRGGMIHLVLQLCRQFEDAFGKAIDGGKGGASFVLEPHAYCRDGWPTGC